MADFERRLEADRACTLGPGSLELTTLHLTGDVNNVITSTSTGMSYDQFGNYRTLANLLVHANRVAQSNHSNLPEINPIALWVSRLCLRADHGRYSPKPSKLGAARLERLFAVLLPQSDITTLEKSIRGVNNPAISKIDPYIGFASVNKPRSFQEMIRGINYLRMPLTADEEAQTPTSQAVYLLGQAGKAAIYGMWYGGLDEAGKMSTAIVPPDAIVDFKLGDRDYAIL